MPKRRNLSQFKVSLNEAVEHLAEADRILRCIQHSLESRGKVIENDYGYKESLPAFLEASLPRLEFIRRQLGKVKD